MTLQNQVVFLSREEGKVISVTLRKNNSLTNFVDLRK